MISNITMDLYRTFFITAKMGSISKAAEELFISQPAVSQSIKHLEEALGSELFIRTPRGVTLTENAELLYHDLEKAFYMFETAEKNYIKRNHKVEGELRINATEILIRYALLPYLNEFSREYPGIRIRLSNSSTPEALNNIKNGKLHIALATLPAPQASNLNVLPLFTFHDIFAAGTEYDFLRDAQPTLKDLQEYPILVLREGMNSRNYLEKLYRDHGLSLEPHMETESIDTLIQCAAYNCGISFVIREVAEKEIAEGRLFEIPVAETIEPRTIGIVTLNNSLPDYAHDFIKGLQASCS